MRPSNIQETAGEVREFLKSLGVHLRQDWIAHCLGQGNALDGPQEAKEAIYSIFLSCDLREAGEACLPTGVGNMANERIRNKVVVQVECSKDIAKNAEQRGKADGESSHHTLKMALGDGRQTVVGFEYRRIQGLPADPPPGLKLLLVEPWVRRGILLLSSDNTVVLGGEVSSLAKERNSGRSGEGNSGTESIAAAAGDRSNHSAVAGNVSNGNSQSVTNGVNRAIPRLSAGEANGRQPNTDTDSVDRRAGTTQSQGIDSDRQNAGVPGRSNAASSGPRQPGGSGVFNPYASAFPAASNPGARSATGTTGDVGEGLVGVTPSRETLQRRGQGGEARVPAFRDIEDDGPQFEYFEEPDFGDDFGDEPQQPPEEPMAHDRSSITRSEPSTITSTASTFPVYEASLSSAPPPVNPRPMIVTARVEHDRLREEGKRRVRESPSDGASSSDHGSEQQQKRSRTDFVSGGGKRDSNTSEVQSGPYASLASLTGAASAGGVHRVKAVVSDTMGCKLRKKKYLLVIEIEDGTAILRVRLSDQITLRLFTVDAREFKKIFQADPDRGLSIQARVEQEIRQMEGVMDIDFSPVSAVASQSPAVPETPGPAASSQGSGFGDAEWSLPVLTSVSSPTDGDCRQLLSRVQGLM